VIEGVRRCSKCVFWMTKLCPFGASGVLLPTDAPCVEYRSLGDALAAGVRPSATLRTCGACIAFGHDLCPLSAFGRPSPRNLPCEYFTPLSEIYRYR